MQKSSAYAYLANAREYSPTPGYRTSLRQLKPATLGIAGLLVAAIASCSLSAQTAGTYTVTNTVAASAGCAARELI